MSDSIIQGLINILKHSIIGIIGWLFFIPLSYIIPKKKNIIVFIGRMEGMLIGNVKYLFLHLQRTNPKNINYYFLTIHNDIYKEFQKNSIPTLIYPDITNLNISFRSIYTIFLLLRASVIVVDNLLWISHLRYHILYNSKIIQLWHGMPLKKIELQAYRSSIYDKIIGRYPNYDMVLSPSEFNTINSFSVAFNSKVIIEDGYPTNDVLFRNPDKWDLMGTDLVSYQQILDYIDNGYKTILYAPTFRDTDGDALQDNVIDPVELNNFAKDNKLVFIFKFHPYPSYDYNIDNLDFLISYDNHKDIYPLLNKVDLLLTDYSSIYFDFLLISKPIVFFPYDFDKYINKDRELIYDYSSMTPGPKCYSQEELQSEIHNILIKGKDDYSEQRKTLLKLAFKYKDGKASERIWNLLEKEYLN